MEETHFIKCESGGLPGTGETANHVSNMLLATADDTLAEIKVESHDVFADENLEEPGTSYVKEEYETKDMKLETQDEAGNTLVDTLQIIKNSATSTDSWVYSCSICHKTFNRRSHFRRHFIIHTGDKSYICSVCNSKFAQKSHLQTHLLTHSGKKPFKCYVCGTSFRRMSHLRDHKITHTKDRPYCCSICSSTFRSSSNLRRHENTHTDPSIPKVSFGKTLAEDNMGTTDSNIKAYSSFNGGHTLGNKGNVKGLVASNSVHKSYVCIICGRAFTRFYNFTRHKFVHSDKFPYLCMLCGKSFKYKEYLKKHSSFHVAEKSFFCAHCGKAFKVKNTLREHVFVHMQHRLLPCNICGKIFRHRTELDNHTKVHSGHYSV